MKTPAVVLLGLLVLAGCAASPSRSKIATLASFPNAVRVQTNRVEIAMSIVEVAEVIRASSLTYKDRYLSVVKESYATRVFVANRDDEVASVLVEEVASELLSRGRASVIDLRTNKSVDFVWAEHSNRGAHGPYFCLPDGTEFLRHVVMIE